MVGRGRESPPISDGSVYRVAIATGSSISPHAMTTILVPIRYPMTAQSTQTLAAAERLAREQSDPQLLVLHVNLFQYKERVKEAEIRRAVAPLIEDVEFAVSVRRGFLVEEVILDEATERNVDCIVVGTNQRPLWRRVLARALRTEPDIAPYLQANVGPDVAVTTVS